MFRAVIFDLDGVLCSTDEYHYLAWKALADRIGVPFDRTVNHRLRGVSREESLNILLEASPKSYSEEEKKRFAAQKNELYRASLAGLSEKDVSEETRATLSELKARGIKIAVGSSSKNTPLILERLGIGTWFDAVADGNDVTRSKPFPDVFLKAAERLGLPPEECLVVEDAASGIEAGVNGGFQTASLGDAATRGLGTFVLRTIGDVLSCVQ